MPTYSGGTPTPRNTGHGWCARGSEATTRPSWHQQRVNGPTPEDAFRHLALVAGIDVGLCTARPTSALAVFYVEGEGSGFRVGAHSGTNVLNCREVEERVRARTFPFA